MAGGFVRLGRDWPRETAFLIAGGPSVLGQDIEALRGRRVIVVNSSVYAAPWADILFFGDERWELHHRSTVKAFAGRSMSATWGRIPYQLGHIEFLRKPKPADVPVGLSPDSSEVWLRNTSVRGAINVLCHLGVSRIVTLGLDGGPDATGKTHHHAPHSRNPNVWTLQRAELEGVVMPLKDRGIELINASPASKLPFWPIVELKDVI